MSEAILLVEFNTPWNLDEREAFLSENATALRHLTMDSLKIAWSIGDCPGQGVDAFLRGVFPHLGSDFHRTKS